MAFLTRPVDYAQDGRGERVGWRGVVVRLGVLLRCNGLNGATG